MCVSKVKLEPDKLTGQRIGMVSIVELDTTFLYSRVFSLHKSSQNIWTVWFKTGLTGVRARRALDQPEVDWNRKCGKYSNPNVEGKSLGGVENA